MTPELAIKAAQLLASLLISMQDPDKFCKEPIVLPEAKRYVMFSEVNDKQNPLQTKHWEVSLTCEEWAEVRKSLPGWAAEAHRPRATVIEGGKE